MLSEVTHAKAERDPVSSMVTLFTKEEPALFLTGSTM